MLFCEQKGGDMFTLDKEKAKEILVSELGQSPGSAEVYVRDYPQIHDQLAEAVKRWLQDRTVLDVKVDSLSISEVMRVQRCHFLAAIFLLNRLLDQDVTEEKRKRLIENLHRPMRRL